NSQESRESMGITRQRVMRGVKEVTDLPSDEFNVHNKEGAVDCDKGEVGMQMMNGRGNRVKEEGPDAGERVL
uniref:hypothetical protein n=1 Tax=Salmonella enterica TaxID=28901 RepID=UPI00398C3572